MNVYQRKNQLILSILKKLTPVALCALAMAGLPTVSFGAAGTWNGSSDTDWNTAANWAGGVPSAGNATIGTNAPNICTVTANPTTNPNDIFINGTTGRVDVRAGTLQTASTNTTGQWLYVGTGGTNVNGTLNVADTSTAGGGISGFAQGSGSVTVGKLIVGGSYFSDNGTGTVRINTAGTITANSTANPFGDGNFLATIHVGGWQNTGNTSNAVGTLYLESGTVQGNGRVNIGNNAQGTVNQSGGIFNSTDRFVIGRVTGAAGTYNLSGGTVNASTTTGYTSIGQNSGSTGILNVSGGIFNASVGGMLVGEAGTGTLTVTNAGSVNIGANNNLGLGGGGTGTVNLDGGIIQARGVQMFSGTSTFNFNGGTLKAATNYATFMQGLTAAYVMAGGAVIDTTNFSITIGQNLQDDGSSLGGLSKNGSGTATLTGANTYAGATTVNAGKLITTTASLASGAVTVANSAGFGVKVLALDAQTIVSNLTLSPTAGTLDVDLGTFGTNTTAPLFATNLLTVNGTITVNVPTGLLPTGAQVPLLAYGTLAGTGTFTSGTLPPGVVGIISNNVTAKTIDLYVISSGTPRWDGMVNGNWDINVTTNWTELSTLLPTVFKSGNPALFDDNATGTKDVVLVTNANPAFTTFTNDSFNYTLSATGTNGITGSGGLAKWGVGSLSISNANTYNGGTTIGGGTLIITNNSALGATNSGVTLTGGALEINGNTAIGRSFSLAANATIGVGTEAAVQLTGPVSGAGGLTKVGNGTLILASNYTAALIQVNAGTGVVAGAVSPAGADVWVGEGSGSSGTLNVNSGGTLTLNNWLVVGRNSGTGTLNVNGGTINQVAGYIDVGSFGSGVAGTLNLNSGTVTTPGEFWAGEDGTAVVNQSGGDISSASWFVISRNNGSVGTYNLTGGTVTAATSTAGSFGVLGSFTGSQGTLNVSGGSFTVAANRRLYVGEGGTGTLNVSGTGLVTCSNVLEGGIRLGVNSTGVGTVNLNGGTIQAALVSQGTGSGTFNFNGGTLKAVASSTTFMQGLTAANVRTNGAIIDTSSNSITIGQALLNNGVDPDGGLTKNGNGTLLLNGVNTYTNVTTVNAGILGGTGSIAGPVTMGASSTLAPGASIGTLTISNNLTFAGGMAVEVDNTNVQTSDLCVVTGTATKSGGGTIIVTNLGPALAVGNTFQLFNTNVVGAGSMTVAGGGAGVTWTNKLAIDGTIMVLTTGAVAPSPTLLTNSVVGGTNLALSWPAGQGWRLQSQVTNRSVGLNTNWVYITDTSVTSTNIAIDKTNGAVFYRLVYP